MDAGQYVPQGHSDGLRPGLASWNDHRQPDQFARAAPVIGCQDEAHGGRFRGRAVIGHFNGDFDGFGGERQRSLLRINRYQPHVHRSEFRPVH